MNTKDPNKNSGSYVNGVYTTKNGYSGSGLNCPKGTRLYNTDVICPIFFMPEDRGATEDFRMITKDVCEDILPYYAVSNYGRVMNVNSGKIMKPNYRPNGYEYYCLAADNCKYGQKKYNTNRIVMQTFEPRENAAKLQVNHIDGDKSHNYINKTMENGTVQSNIEWNSPSENIAHARSTGLNNGAYSLKFTNEQIQSIRNLRDQGYSYGKINDLFPDASYATIQAICKNVLYKDENYVPAEFSPYEKIDYNHLKVSDSDAENIRKLVAQGMKHKEIVEQYYPNISESTVSDIVRRISHNR